VAATILVCDDRETLRELARGALAGNGYTIIEAGDGDESLELARSFRPDVIVLDLVLPGRSGLDVLEAVRRDPALAATQVIVCTAAHTFDPAVVDHVGVDRYLPKPYSPTELASIVSELLEARP
jgi:CheY-like chemotaxis protein